MRKLESAALSAFRLYKWLLASHDRLKVPVATCELLLSPSARELKLEPKMADFSSEATLENFLRTAKRWRENSEKHREGFSLFYFAGHGVQRIRRDHVLVLQDFGDGIGGLLRNAVDTTQLIGGMAPTAERRDIARTQLYFVDACRVRPKTFHKYETVDTSPIWDIEELEEAGDDRITPVFYTAVPGRKAFARPGDETVFCKALLACLNGGASEKVDDETGEARWCITVSSLAERIGKHLDLINEETGSRQRVTIDGFARGPTLICSDTPPHVPVVLEVDPPPARTVTEVTVTDDEEVSVWELAPPLKPSVCRRTLPAGDYWVTARANPPDTPYRGRRRSYALTPPQSVWRVRMASDEGVGPCPIL